MEKDTTIGLEAKEDLLGNMETFGPLYAGSIKYYKGKGLPIFEIGTTQESEHPYRKGKCFIYRNPGSATGRYLGLWVKNPRLNPDDYESIDAILLGALSQFNAKDEDKNTYENWWFYRTNTNTHGAPLYVQFALTGEMKLHVREDQEYFWDKYLGDAYLWKTAYASRCEEHGIPAVLFPDTPCQELHIEVLDSEADKYVTLH